MTEYPRSAAVDETYTETSEYRPVAAALPRRTPVQRRRRHIKRILKRRNRFQFGQPPRTTRLVKAGAVACTDTCIQLIELAWHGKKVSLDDVRRSSGGPRDGSRGLRPDEALRALRSYGLPYEVRSDLSAADAMRIARNRGPIIVAENYWAHPQWKGYRYMGLRPLTGWAYNGQTKRVRVGFSRPLKRSGLTQPTFRNGHAVLLASSYVNEDNEQRGLVRDPNHNSPVRPERPSWDDVSVYQLRRMMNSIRPSYAGRVLLYVPTERMKV